MDEHDYINSLKDLTGKVAVVTGGAGGIGLQTTILLARLGATVYVCSRDTPKNQAGLAAAQEELKRYRQEAYSESIGAVELHVLDLESVKGARSSAESLREKIEAKEGRLDILIANAGIAFATLDQLTVDGVEKCFGVNCLGHFVFINTLLGLLEKTEAAHGEARIVITSSRGYKLARKLDYTALTTAIPDDGKRILDMGGGFQRYLNSKLATAYLGLELDKRIHEKGHPNLFVNICHPGDVPGTGLGGSQQPWIGPLLSAGLRNVLGVFMRQSAKDAAKTQVFLAASEDIPEKHVHGEYWMPTWSWLHQYTGCVKEELATEIARDEEEWKKTWEFCESIVAK